MGIYDLLDSLDLWERVMTDIPTELFYDYLANMERFLEAEARKLRETLEATKRQMESGELTEPSCLGKMPVEIEAMEHLKYQLQQIKEFENILRKSFFVTIYAFLESRLLEDCRSQLSKRDDISLSLRDIGGHGIDKAKTCMKILKVPLDTSCSQWSEIQKYKQLRHCIVHNEGRLDEGFPDSKGLRSYVSANPSLSLSPNGEIILSKDSCKEALDTVTMFLMPRLLVD